MEKKQELNFSSDPFESLILEVDEAAKSYKPEFTQTLENQITIDGREAHLVCRVIGHPTPEVTWFKDTEIIESSDEFFITHEDDLCMLYINEIYPEDAGKYIVVAKNECGVASVMASLIVEGDF